MLVLSIVQIMLIAFTPYNMISLERTYNGRGMATVINLWFVSLLVLIANVLCCISHVRYGDPFYKYPLAVLAVTTFVMVALTVKQSTKRNLIAIVQLPLVVGTACYTLLF